MKHLQIKVTDQQHRKLKYHCASEGITLNDWLQMTVKDALDTLQIDFKESNTVPQKERLYIAYGSNLNLSQMQYRCPTAVPIANAVLPRIRSEIPR